VFLIDINSSIHSSSLFLPRKRIKNYYFNVIYNDIVERTFGFSSSLPSSFIIPITRRVRGYADSSDVCNR